MARLGDFQIVFIPTLVVQRLDNNSIRQVNCCPVDKWQVTTKQISTFLWSLNINS